MIGSAVCMARWLPEARRLLKRAKRLGAREHVVFGGRVPLQPGNFIERSIAKKSAPEHRDLRDWDRIRGWAAGMASELSGSGDPVAVRQN